MAGALLGALVTAVGTYLELRPNRILGGDSVTAIAAFGPGAWALLGLWALMFAACLPGTGRTGAMVRGLVANTTMVVSVLLVARRATAFVAQSGDVARASLGISFWLSLGAAYIVIFSALPRAKSRNARALVSLPGIVMIAGLLFTGQLNSLSILVEYAVNADSFNKALVQQLSYTLGATGIALVIGLLAGVGAAKNPRLEGPVFATLNIAQVLPSLSFIGLLIVPMGWLGLNFPALKALGVSGIGWAPVFVVLLSYALYPITRNVYTSLKTLDESITDAARGMGMKPIQRLFTVELPLAFPVIIAGVRIAAVQTTAAAILAALVGGGGLGQIVFFGVQQTATDLILLGVIPIVALSLTIDASLRFVETLVRTAQEGGLT
jgi:osmoprotectant transport system permease protein